MSPYEMKMKSIDEYQSTIGSQRRYLYEVYSTNHVSNILRCILADTDDEARHVALLLDPSAVWMRRDHWGYGDRIELQTSEVKS